MKEEWASLLFSLLIFDFSENNPESAESIGEEDDRHESHGEPEKVKEAKYYASFALVSVFLDEACINILGVFEYGIANSPAEDTQECQYQVTRSKIE